MNADRRFRDECHLSFSGGGFLGIYHVGVLQAFKDFAPEITTRKVLGASSGALACTCLACDLPVFAAIETITRMTVHCRSLSLGPLHPRFNIFDIMRDGLEKYLPEDAHIRSAGRLFISVTRASTLTNELLCKFDSREELIDALMASCFIPYFLGFVGPTIKGVHYIDGGISCNIPVHDEFSVTVSPFAERDTLIRPRWEVLPEVTSMSASMMRMCKTVFAPPPQTLVELCHQGYGDAVHFLRERGMLVCRQCAAQQNKSPRKKNNKTQAVTDCSKCESLFRRAKSSKMPKRLLKTMLDAAAAEKRHRELHPLISTDSVQTLAVIFSILVLPITLLVAVVLKVYRYFGEHSAFVGYAKQVASQNDMHSDTSSDGSGKSSPNRPYSHC